MRLIISFASSEEDTFWKWHTIVDEPRLRWVKDQATPTVSPAAGTIATVQPNSITITFDKKVSTGAGLGGANAIRLTFAALKVNGSAATAMTDEDATNPFTQFKFTGFAPPAPGEVTVELAGTASYSGSPPDGWKFTYTP